MRSCLFPVLLAVFCLTASTAAAGPLGFFGGSAGCANCHDGLFRPPIVAPAMPAIIPADPAAGRPSLPAEAGEAGRPKILRHLFARLFHRR
jgi:hypothetical protein